MLVLQCKAGEVIRIGESISVRVIANQKGQLRLAIDAPKEIAIKRGVKPHSSIQDVS